MGYAHPNWLMIELGKHWEIYVTRTMAENLHKEAYKAGNAIFKSRSFIKKLRASEIIPFWYGFAAYEFDCDRSVYMPIPLNVVRAGWEWFKMRVLRNIKFEWPHSLVRGSLKLRYLVRDSFQALDRLDSTEHPFNPGYHNDLDTIRQTLERLRG